LDPTDCLLMKDGGMEQKLRSEAKALLEQGKVDYIIGFEPGSLKFTTTPLITSDKDDIDRLIINPFIVNNLSQFLNEVKGRVGIVAKGCDSRSVVQLLQEGLIRREDVVIFGIPCRGVVDLSKIRARINTTQIKGVSFKDDTITIETSQGVENIPLDDVLATKCLSCQYPTPVLYDYLNGEALPALRATELLYTDVDKIETMDIKERLAYWERELDRCIRCYACRNACPMCVCQDFCAADARNPHWLSQKTGIGEKVMWQIMHALHLAGRCTDCGECERACPMDIPIQRIRRKINKEIRELFDYEAGISPDGKPPLYTFQPEEPTIKEKEW